MATTIAAWPGSQVTPNGHLTLSSGAHERITEERGDIVDDEHARRRVVPCFGQYIEKLWLEPEHSRHSQPVENRGLQ